MSAATVNLVSLLLAVFVTGVAVGKLVEKIERFISRKEDEEHGSAKKTTAVRKILERL